MCAASRYVWAVAAGNDVASLHWFVKGPQPSLQVDRKIKAVQVDLAVGVHVTTLAFNRGANCRCFGAEVRRAELGELVRLSAT